MKLSFEEIAALQTDIKNDNIEAIQEWIARGLEPEKKLNDDYPYSMLQMAAHLGAVNTLRYLIESGVKINKGVRNWTPLMEAVGGRQREAVDILLQAGADPNLQSGADDEGDSKITALMLAAENRDMQMMRTLLNAGADPKAVSNKGRSALTLTINGNSDGRMEMVQELVKAGTPAVGACLVWPAEDGDLELTRVLIAAGADPNVPSDKFDQTPAGPGVLPIHLAIMARWMFRMMKMPERRHLDVIRELIKGGADVNLESKGLWQIRRDSIKGDKEVAGILKKAG